MSKQDSWKTIALVLASRLEHARNSDHRPPDPMNCPSCKDAEAYQRFERRLARDGEYIPRHGGGPSIPIHELIAKGDPT